MVAHHHLARRQKPSGWKALIREDRPITVAQVATIVGIGYIPAQAIVQGDLRQRKFCVPKQSSGVTVVLWVTVKLFFFFRMG